MVKKRYITGFTFQVCVIQGTKIRFTSDLCVKTIKVNTNIFMLTQAAPIGTQNTNLHLRDKTYYSKQRLSWIGDLYTLEKG